ncbi:MAG TPA: hypothetical protein VFB93_18465 [Burkholderiales bacterium]|nr:hypothetical protein [Burkholderiales bacterium]
MLARLASMALMAIIVASLLFVPAVVGFALLIRVLGFSPEPFATFGGAVHPVVGLCAWWLAAFVGACAYAAFTFPWDVQAFPFRKR